MYFWNIKKLKEQLIERPLTERETLPYLIATTLMYILLIELIVFGYSVDDGVEPIAYGNWDYLAIIFNVAITVFGSFWLFKLNAAHSENHFLQRYTTLGWLVMLRTTAFILLVFIALFFVAEMMQSDAISKLFDSDFAAFLAGIAFYGFFYWYFGKHLADVAHKAKY